MEGLGENERKSKQDVCHRAGYLLVDYLQNFFAINHQSVVITTYKNDTLPLQYARVAMAKQSFSSFSTFGMIPIIGTFGEGYFQTADANADQSVIRNIISDKYKGFDNIHMMNGNILSPERIATMKFDEISEWLKRSPS